MAIVSMRPHYWPVTITFATLSLVILTLRASAAEPNKPVVVAVIGDYGVCGNRTPYGYWINCKEEVAVARMVRGWNPAFVVTAGDNSYDMGLAEEIPADQAPYNYFIHRSRFFPSLGNHDWGSHRKDAPPSANPTLDFFRMPHRYYVKRVHSLVSFYLLDTNPEEPDGDSPTSKQAKWFRQTLREQKNHWNIAINHHPPYGSCSMNVYDGSIKGSDDYRWLAEDGIDLVISGHYHIYERILRPNFRGNKDIPYVIAGASGAPLHKDCQKETEGQQKLITDKYGALRLTISRNRIIGEFFEPGTPHSLDRFEIVYPQENR